MPKSNVREWDEVADNNTDVGGINIGEGTDPSNINNGMREIMAQVKTNDLAKPWEQIGDIRDDSGVTSINWTDLSAYRFLRLRGGVIPSTANQTISMRFSINNGVSWLSSGYSRLATTTGSKSDPNDLGSAPAVFLPENDTLSSIYLTTKQGVSNTNRTSIVFFEAQEWNKADVCRYDFITSYFNAANNVEYRSAASGRDNQTTARDALQIYASSGNISAIGLVLEGIRA